MREMIPFHRPTHLGTELSYIRAVLDDPAWNSGITAEERLAEITGAKQVLLTTSCTHALEMCALLLDIREGDEVIMPSFTFVSAANAFVLRGARIVFVDVDPGTMNVDPVNVQAAINDRTKAILIMHYGGVACDIRALRQISQAANVPLIEDAAHCIGAYYEGKHLGSFGDLATLSFHYTKNLHCTEGGALLINNDLFRDRAVILRDKGTNRSAFMNGVVDRYTWVDIGSSYSLGELNAAMLLAQLERLTAISEKRIKLWNVYYEQLSRVLQKDRLPKIAPGVNHNGHLFYLHCQDEQERTNLQKALLEAGIKAYFHYVPLHSSIAGQRYGYFKGKDVYTTSLSESLLRLPLYTSLSIEAVQDVIDVIKSFYRK